MTTAPASTRKYTVDDLVRMPDGDLYELVDGELRVTCMGVSAARTTARVIRRLDEYTDRTDAGVVYSASLIFRIFDDESQSRRAGLSFFRRHRAPHDDALAATTAPDLVVEVVSWTNRTEADRKKVELWLSAGVGMVWVLLPSAREVTVYRRGHRPRILTAEDTIEGDDLLPGFSAVVADLFPLPESANVGSLGGSATGPTP